MIIVPGSLKNSTERADVTFAQFPPYPSRVLQKTRTNSVGMYIKRFIERNWLMWLWRLVSPQSALWAGRLEAQES